MNTKILILILVLITICSIGSISAVNLNSLDSGIIGDSQSVSFDQVNLVLYNNTNITLYFKDGNCLGYTNYTFYQNNVSGNTIDLNDLLNCSLEMNATLNNSSGEIIYKENASLNNSQSNNTTTSNSTIQTESDISNNQTVNLLNNLSKNSSNTNGSVNINSSPVNNSTNPVMTNSTPTNNSTNNTNGTNSTPLTAVMQNTGLPIAILIICLVIIGAAVYKNRKN